MAQLSPYLEFDGNCREAMTFYRDCLGGTLELNTVGDSPMAAQMPKETHGRIIHSQLTSPGIVVMACDAMHGSPPAPGGTITLCLSSADRDEIRAAFGRLAASGTITQPLDETFFGLFGAITDRFGLRWIVQAGSGPNS